MQVESVQREHEAIIQVTIESKTKPPGALGQLEETARLLARRLGPARIKLERPVMVVFAGDHGISAEGVSVATSIVTHQMVRNFLSGGAAINVFCQNAGMALEVVDAGIALPIDDEPKLVRQSLGPGTNNFVVGPAMSEEQVERGLAWGRQVSHLHATLGSNIIGFGEMGIGNTSAASALMALTLGLPAELCVGRGTGINEKTLQKKLRLISEALQRHAQAKSPQERLAAVGGFEIVQLTGAMLGAAEAGMVILVDGFIASVAALLAVDIEQGVKDSLLFCHRSGEQGHERLLQYFAAKPLLDLGLRLGEGTGAALAYPIVRAAAAFYNDMASFDDLGISLP